MLVKRKEELIQIIVEAKASQVRNEPLCNSLRGRLIHARGCFNHRGVTGPLVDYDGPLLRAQLLLFLRALQEACPSDIICRALLASGCVRGRMPPLN